ncbi:neutral zinc metallopeptidase [Euzebya tangerina]|uniref:KPN_02809 family neutral zinc metallopeptidase n=1 Tax=Euzebya tangerina TaxID=591198 RepID=UPI000E3241CC|nr:neutral zinc metallopeptidase [Euzebya tangerina]
MKFERRGQLSDDIEDRRGERPRGRTAAIGGGGLGLGAILVLVFTLLTGSGGDLGSILGEVGAQVAQPAGGNDDIVETGGEATSEQDQFISFVLDDIQAFWTDQFAATGRIYDRTTLVLYTGGTDTAGCGFGSATTGPFYCPADSKVYIDLTFFNQLASRFGAPGDFAQAYVLAHEIGHHIQNVLGISSQVRNEQQANPGQANDLSVRLELQADCLAGVWAFSAFSDDLLESGDLEEGLRAAAAVGDDSIQSNAGVPVNSETWTHGSSEQRMRWFREGFDAGDPNVCDTFSGSI